MTIVGLMPVCQRGEGAEESKGSCFPHYSVTELARGFVHPFVVLFALFSLSYMGGLPNTNCLKATYQPPVSCQPSQGKAPTFASMSFRGSLPLGGVKKFEYEVGEIIIIISM